MDTVAHLQAFLGKKKNQCREFNCNIIHFPETIHLIQKYPIRKSVVIANRQRSAAKITILCIMFIPLYVVVYRYGSALDLLLFR